MYDGMSCSCQRLFSGDGYLPFPTGEHCGCHAPCHPNIKQVTCVEACKCDEPVKIEVTGTFNEIGTNCWELVFCADMLRNVSTAPILLVDSEGQAFMVFQTNGNKVRYDQLVALVDERRRDGWWGCEDRQVKLSMYFGNDGAPGHELHVQCFTELPPSKFQPTRLSISPRREAVV